MKSILDIFTRGFIQVQKQSFCNRTFIRIFLIRPSGNGGYLSIPKSR